MQLLVKNYFRVKRQHMKMLVLIFIIVNKYFRVNSDHQRSQFTSKNMQHLIISLCSEQLLMLVLHLGLLAYIISMYRVFSKLQWHKNEKWTKKQRNVYRVKRGMNIIFKSRYYCKNLLIFFISLCFRYCHEMLQDKYQDEFNQLPS